MLVTKLAVSTEYHPQTDGLSERMIQTIEDIPRRFCAYGMEYKDHEGYTHDLVTLLPEVKLSDNTKEGKFPSKKKNPTPPEIVEVEDSPGSVNIIIRARKMRLNGRDQRQYLGRFRNQTADKDKWLAEDVIPGGNLHLRRFRGSRRTEKSHQ
ncbi:hypothetical protein O181_128417 [Austropuccinia psidii MF-1]|uniref:Integrase catalytic domain-containing protein n=1 Tax=Austropuccinia psidii MF-1 TaxID=1389203 RepID=A0A9Q3KX82_9BASI|nr:hypothetical protein [Austropuccinia psidii MF-1]